jgi:hypothetical protein
LIFKVQSTRACLKFEPHINVVDTGGRTGTEMSNGGKPIDDEDLVSYILAGLDDDYN